MMFLLSENNHYYHFHVSFPLLNGQTKVFLVLRMSFSILPFSYKIVSFLLPPTPVR